MTTISAERATMPELAAPDAAPPAPDAPVSDNADPGTDTNDNPATTPKLRGFMWPVAVVGLVGGLLVAGIGFALSYDTLRGAAVGWGFGPTAAAWFPIGIDGAIVAFFAIDLWLAYRKTPKALLRIAAHGMTLATIALNAGAGHGSVWADPWRTLAHAAMPVVFVIAVDAVRHAITRKAALESGVGTLTARQWLLAPISTWNVWRDATITPCSYDAARTARRERLIYRVWLAHRQEIEAALDAGTEGGERVGTLDRLPDLLAPYGVSVDDALALPERMRRADQERRAAAARERQELEHQAAADRRALEHAERLAALAAEAEQLRAAGDVAVLRARVEGETAAAGHIARAAADTAGIRAAADKTAAERAAAEAQRLADAEERAEETARTAAARRATAEHAAAQAEAEVRAAAARATTAEANRAAAAADSSAAAARRRAEEDAEASAAAERRAAEHRAATARAELVAVAAEDEARLSGRERAVRKVARLILAEAGGDAERLPLYRIETALSVANGTASGYRSEAAALIAGGYRPPAVDTAGAPDADMAWSGVTHPA
ncbi:DUF2637 domain-containing protein [Streptomyces sp. H10-C2]|uniref:DUF2637 domain-containing protein n=1 Tax=unclassified Streptomyces TaxID=2593676 RepID=UPI0024BA0C15|nr:MULTISPECIES: DUF2637 domain-containing protein [unclassified Streptomyces]MDJ0347145.1 DUF2637 domain-containing protein [Streptomyces sp. PH10-H1]MDJ0375404.1 DUF2637 domain-containing protein [Streptomyces sp. H10-C2]